MRCSFLSCCLVDVLCCVLKIFSFFFDFPMYFPLHVQFNWQTSGLLFDNSFGIFLHKMHFKFYPVVKATFWSTFLKSCFNFGPIFRIHGNFLIFSKLNFLLFFFFLFWYSQTKYSRNEYCVHFRQTRTALLG